MLQSRQVSFVGGVRLWFGLGLVEGDIPSSLPCQELGAIVSGVGVGWGMERLFCFW